MWTSGFFNSVNGDRVYNARQMSEIFEGLITNGVYESVGDKMAVQPNNGMTIQVATGRGWFNKHWVNNDTAYLITLEDADVTLNRYAAICVRVDDTDSVRDAVLYVKYSEYATTPVKPTMTRTSSVNEYCLAYVYIKAGATAITNSDITDTRADESLCGWVTGLIEQLNSSTLWTQWEALFNEWFRKLQDLINENTEAVLVNAMPVSSTRTIAVGDWKTADNGYNATVTVTGMTATKTVFCEPESVTTYSINNIQLTSQDTNTLVFTADTVPTEAVTVKIVHMGV